MKTRSKMRTGGRLSLVKDCGGPGVCGVGLAVLGASPGYPASPRTPPATKVTPIRPENKKSPNMNSAGASDTNPNKPDNASASVRTKLIRE